ncbi:MAG TPA: hypothetical protein VNO79_03035, partial [Actinomycetota bacterium]|nr:hypothetical protein [Actinomycetota bacterium]
MEQVARAMAPANLGNVVRRTRRLRVRRRVAALVAGAAVLALFAASVGALLPLLGGSGRLGAGSGEEPSPAGSPSPTSAFSPFAPPTFEPAPDWYTLTTTTDPAGLAAYDPEEVGHPTAWVANVPFAAEDLARSAPDGYLRWESRPGETMRSLPPEGIVIVVTLFPPTEATPSPVFPARELPLQLSDFEVRPSWEGQVAPNVPEYRLWASVGG